MKNNTNKTEKTTRTLSEWIEFESANQNYDCPQAMLEACNEYYGLGLNEMAIEMMKGFGEGLFIHKTCGALIGAAAAMCALMYRSEKETGKQFDIESAMQTLVNNFKAENKIDSINCADIKPVNWEGEKRFVRTDLNAGKALEKTLAEFQVL